MRSNIKHITKELNRYIDLYINEGISYRVLCERYGLLLSDANFYDKVLRYQDHGLVGIQSSITNGELLKKRCID